MSMTVEDMKNAVVTFVNIAEEYIEPKGFEELDNNGVEISNALSELEAYRAIGTVEELRELKEKATAKKMWLYVGGGIKCPSCGMRLQNYEGVRKPYCKFCGQRLER